MKNYILYTSLTPTVKLNVLSLWCTKCPTLVFSFYGQMEGCHALEAFLIARLQKLVSLSQCYAQQQLKAPTFCFTPTSFSLSK